MPYLYATAFALFVLSTPAHAGDINYCRPYAAQLTQTFINYVWKRAYTACLNVEGEDPIPPNNWLTAWNIVAPESDLKAVALTSKTSLDVSKIGNVPATDAPKGKKVKTDPVEVAAIDPAPDPVDPPPTKSKKRVRTALADPTPQSSGGAPQALCTSHKMRTVYTANGKSWNCRK
jgi:hypothetical protein